MSFETKWTVFFGLIAAIAILYDLPDWVFWFALVAAGVPVVIALND